jgi:hypothetical protein
MGAIETIARYGVFVPLPEKTTSVLDSLEKLL